jgi:hypothetical protein
VSAGGVAIDLLTGSVEVERCLLATDRIAPVIALTEEGVNEDEESLIEDVGQSPRSEEGSIWWLREKERGEKEFVSACVCERERAND